MARLPRPSQCQVLSRYSACPSSPARRPPPAPPTPTGCSSGYPGTPLPQRCGCRRNPVRLPLRYSRGSAAEPNCSAPEPECLLSEYVVRRVPFENTSSYYIQVDRYPRAYLKHGSEVQKHAIEPALKALSDPVYKAPDEQFQTALKRQREGDYDGCVTACYSAVEGTIKVAAAKLRIRKLKGNSLESQAQSFIAKTSLPDMSQGMFRDLSDWRNTEGDAHGHATRTKVTEEIAQYFIAKAAALIALVQSQVK